MNTVLQRIKCIFGVHTWSQSRKITLYDIFPAAGDTSYSSVKRRCSECGKRQRWLPGYGGSELGCWITTGVAGLEEG